MRSILTISLPAKEKVKIEKMAKKAKKTVSAFMLEAVKHQETLVSEDEILEMAERARAEHRAGKTKLLRSLKDLMN